MEEINFTALAPRKGNKPMLTAWSHIGTSQMSGGAFNWGSIWSGLKNVGSTIKHWGNKAWSSSTGEALRQKLKDTNLQEKIVDGLSTGIHGAVDIARQHLDKAIESRLENPPEEEEEIFSEKGYVEAPIIEKGKSTRRKKRPLEEDFVITTEEPPAYDTVFPNYEAPKQITKQVSIREPVFTAPTTSNWQNTLNNIVGLGLPYNKKRRCF
ncbi:pVI [Mastadenovirus eidoli]|uniref:PVI n=1 Tax=Eidolon helvum adenovirus TaxID=2039267 RepID=A0A348FKG7_9ADEN|nr:pVI [Eidolon helvum adenovirus]BBF72834.1 pVI [Eidolon helvum adenovirus]